MIFAESIEEKPIDRDYNKHMSERMTHYEIFGGVFHTALEHVTVRW